MHWVRLNRASHRGAFFHIGSSWGWTPVQWTPGIDWIAARCILGIVVKRETRASSTSEESFPIWPTHAFQSVLLNFGMHIVMMDPCEATFMVTCFRSFSFVGYELIRYSSRKFQLTSKDPYNLAVQRQKSFLTKTWYSYFFSWFDIPHRNTMIRLDAWQSC